MTLLGINVKAKADFSDIEREAERASARVKREFQSTPTASRPSSEVIGGTQQGAVRQVDALQRALERTHQSGLKLRNIKLPVSQFGDAEKQIRAIERQIALLHTSPWGKDLKRRLISHGEDLGRPFGWNWDRLYGGNAAAGQGARDQFYRGAFHVPAQALTPAQSMAPSAMSTAIGNAIGRFMQHSGARAGAMVGGAAGAAAGDVAGGAAGGGLAAAITRMGPVGIAGGLAAAVVGKLGLDAAVEGHREYLRTLDNVDTMLKQVGGDSGFKSLQEQVRQLGGDLHMAGSEAGHLARSFIATSGAMDASTAFERVGFAGSWGRGMGLEPEAATTRFARASLVGYGQTKSEQREFALLLGQTIGGSGMFARTEQVMDDLVGQIESVATQQLRTANSGEISQLARMLETIYQDPAMRGGGSGTVMDALQRQGSKGGFAQEVLAWQAFGEAVGWDPAKVIQMQEATPFTSPADLFGEGFSKQTRAELVHEATKNVSPLLPGVPEDQYAYYHNIASGTPMAVGKAVFRLMEDLEASGNSVQDFRDWVTKATGRDIEGQNAIEPAAYGPLSQLWALRGDESESAIAKRRAMAEEYLTGGNVTPELAEAMRAALNDGKALAQILPKAAASTETLGTAAEQHHASVADLTNQLVRLGDEAEAVMMAFRSLRETMVSGLATGVDVAKDGASVVGDGALSVTQRIFKAIFPDAGASARPAIDVGTDATPSATPAPEFIFNPSSTEPVVEPSTPSEPAAVEPSVTRQTTAVEPSATRQTAAVEPSDQVEWNRYLRELETSRGLPEGILSGIEEVETGAWKADPQQRATITNPTSGATGWFQFKPATAKRFGIDPHDPVAAARGAADYLEANAGYLRRRGVEPTTDALLASFYAGEGAVAKAGGPPEKTRQYIADAKARMAEVQQVRPVRQSGVLRRVDEDLAARVEGFLSEAKARGHDLSISSGYRSQQEQDALRKRLAGTDVPVAKRSKHTRGAAVDVALPGGSADDALRAWAPDALKRWGLQTPVTKRESPKDARSRHWHLELAEQPIMPPVASTARAVEPDAPLAPALAMSAPTAPTMPVVKPDAPVRPPIKPDVPTARALREAISTPPMADDGTSEFPSRKTIDAPELSQTGDRYMPPRIPPDLERAVAATTSPQAIDARWQGQVSMDLTFRDARGNAVQRRHMLTVSEPRIPGSGGSDLTGGRFSWNDTVTVPSFT